VGKVRWDTGDVVQPWFRGTTCRRGLHVVCLLWNTAYVIESCWVNLKLHFVVGLLQVHDSVLIYFPMPGFLC
jgi:hypothetical protein